MTMPFWKKGEDPWDIDPEKRRRPPEETAEAGETGEPAPGLLEELRDWNEARKQKKAESVPPPIPCPWCGKEMETGYLVGGRGIWWAPGRPNGWAKWVSVSMVEGAFQVDNEGGLPSYQTAWHCAGCRRLVLESPELPSGGEPEKQPEEPGAPL